MGYEDFTTYYDGNRYIDTDAINRAFNGTAGYSGRYSDFVTLGADGAEYIDAGKLNYAVEKARTEQRAYEGFIKALSNNSPRRGNYWIEIDNKPYIISDAGGNLHPVHLIHNRNCQLNKNSERISGFSSQEQAVEYILSNMSKRPSVFCPFCFGKAGGAEELYDSLAYTIRNGKPRTASPKIKLTRTRTPQAPPMLLRHPKKKSSRLHANLSGVVGNWI